MKFIMSLSTTELKIAEAPKQEVAKTQETVVEKS